MELIDIFIYLFGFLTILSAAGVVFSSKSLNSALCLVATLTLIAVHFALMRADFVATLQILVYAGAIMILVVFVIMLLGVEKDAEKVSIGVPSVMGAFFGVIFLLLLCSLLKGGSREVYELANSATIKGTSTGDAKTIGKLLLVDYILAFQGVGVLLFAAIIAAAKLSFSKKQPMLPGRGLKAVQDKYQETLEQGE